MPLLVGRLHHLAATPNAPGVDQVDPDPNEEFKSARFSPDAGQIAFHASHQGRYPRFDEDGAVPGFVYVGQDDMGHHPLQRDILGSGGSSGFVTMGLGAFPSVSVLGSNHHVITSPAGIERVTQAGMRSHISDEKGAMNVDASLDGLQVLYVAAGKPSLFIAAGF